MFKITIERQYKYNYVIIRNQRVVTRFNTKKQARDELYRYYQYFKKLNFDQDIINFSSQLLQGGDSLIIYTFKNRNFSDFQGFEFKDTYKIKRIINENY